MKQSLYLNIVMSLLLCISVGCRKDSADQGAKKTTTVTKTVASEGGEENAEKSGEKPADNAEATEKKTIKLAFDQGIDAEKQVIYLGALNDESGHAAAIGKPWALGKRLLVEAVNAGGTGYIPDGWTVELVEKDHGYNPQKAVQAYQEIKDKVLFLATSFGTPTTLPLRKGLARDNMVAFPASLSSKMAENKNTPPLGPSYEIEAMRAMDWAVENAGGADKVKAAIIYQQDDYGSDGLAGWKKAAAHHKVKVVSEQTVKPGQKDVAAVVMALKEAGATHVLMTVLPSTTGPVLGTAAKLQFMPVWIGQTPTWIDLFFSPKVIPAAVFAKFYWVQGVPYWGEKSEGMDRFLKVFSAYAEKNPGTRPDFYTLSSYIQGLTQLEAVKRGIEAGDITRAGFMKALQGMKDWTAGNFIQPVDLSAFPYVTSTHARILKGVMDKATWSVVSDYAAPKTAL